MINHEDWMKRKKQEILRRWKKEEASYLETVRELVDTGVPAEAAFDLVAKT